MINFERETRSIFEAIYGDLGLRCVIFTDYFFQFVNQTLNRVLKRGISRGSKYYVFLYSDSQATTDYVIQSLIREILCCAIECRIKMNREKGQRAPFILDEECITRLLKENVDLASI